MKIEFLDNSELFNESLYKIISYINKDSDILNDYKERNLHITSDLDFNFTLYSKIKKDFKIRNELIKKNFTTQGLIDIKYFWNTIKKPLKNNIFLIISLIIAKSLLSYLEINFLSILTSFITYGSNIIKENNNISFFPFLYNAFNSSKGYKVLLLMCSTLLYRLSDFLFLEFINNFLLEIKGFFIKELFKKSYLFFSENSVGKIIETIDQIILGYEDLIVLFMSNLLKVLLNIFFSFHSIFLFFINGDENIILFLFCIIWLCIHFMTMFYYLDVISNILYLSNKHRLTANSITTDTLYNVDSIKRCATENLERKNIFNSHFLESYYDKKTGKIFNKIKFLCSISLFSFRIISLLGIIIKVFNSSNFIEILNDGVILTMLSNKYEFSSNAHEGVYELILLLDFFYRLLPNIKIILQEDKNDDIDLTDDYYKKYYSGASIFSNFNDINKSEEPITRNNEISKEDLKINCLSLKNVNLTLNDSKLLKDINFTFENNKKYGLVGYSGSGKTTLLNIISRILDITEGNILYNNNNIQHYSKTKWSNLITYIPQTPCLFNRTVFENVIYGTEDFTLNEVIKACKESYAYHFIQKLPGKFNFIVGNKGEKLSGGQRQRIMLARSFLKNNCKIVLVDEATSALDSKTEKIVLKSINSLVKDKIAIFISHDIDQFKNFDSIIVLEKGMIVEFGKFDELLAKNGFFAKLWDIHENVFEI